MNFVPVYEGVRALPLMKMALTYSGHKPSHTLHIKVRFSLNLRLTLVSRHPSLSIRRGRHFWGVFDKRHHLSSPLLLLPCGGQSLSRRAAALPTRFKAGGIIIPSPPLLPYTTILQFRSDTLDLLHQIPG